MKIGINGFALKLTAIIAMTIDHIGAMFFSASDGWVYLFMRSIGAMTFPIMAFMVCEGYRHTGNLDKYKIRLIIFSIVSMLPFALAFGKATYGLNVGFTLLFGLCAAECCEKIENKLAKWVIVALLAVLSAEFDWGFTGVWLILMLYIAGDSKGKIVFALFAAVALFVVKNQAMVFIQRGEFYSIETIFKSTAFLRHMGFVPAAAALCLYNKERGIRAKGLFYIYYPAHLVLLSAIGYII